MIKIKSVESYQLPEKTLYEDFKTYRMTFTNGKYLVYHFLETSKKYLLVITSGYSDYWFHTDISKQLSKKYSILILDTPGMGTATDKTKKDFYNIVSINSRVFYIDHVLDQFVNDSDDNNDNDNDSDDDSDNDSKFLKISFLAHSTSCLFITKYLEKGKRIKNIDKVIFNSPFFDINISGFKRFLGYNILAPLGNIFPNINIFANIAADKNSIYSQHIKKNLSNTDIIIHEKYKSNRQIIFRLGTLREIIIYQKYLKTFPSINLFKKVIVYISDKTSLYKNSTDIILDVKQLKIISKGLGMKCITIKSANHDMFVSIPSVREKAIEQLKLDLEIRS